MYKIIRILKIVLSKNQNHYLIINYKKMRNSLPWVLSVCSTLQFPGPTADKALTLTLYSVPASSSVRIVDVRGGEPWMVLSLPHCAFLLLLYCTLYREMVRSLCGAVQVTLRAGNPDLTALDRDTPVT